MLLIKNKKARLGLDQIRIDRLAKVNPRFFHNCLPKINQSIRSLLNESVAQKLKSDGYAVCDNFFGAEACNHLLRELKQAVGKNLLLPNATHVVAPDRKSAVFFEKPHIYEIELLNPTNQTHCPHFSALQKDTSLIDRFNELLPDLKLQTQAIKAQYNEGFGGCFPIHPDSDYKVDSRQLSCVFYLNPDWEPGHGGELRLYPFPFKPVDIDPIFDRIVIFSSSLVLHRVLPAYQPRYCFTIWLSGEGERVIDMPRNKDATGWDLLLSPRNRRHVARLVYEDEWAESILESHSAPSSLQLLQDHQSSIDIIKSAFASYLPLIYQESVPQELHSKIVWL